MIINAKLLNCHIYLEAKKYYNKKYFIYIHTQDKTDDNDNIIAYKIPGL